MASIALVRAVDGSALTRDTVRLAYRDDRPPDVANPPVVMLLHGSPGSGSDFARLLPPIARYCRVIVPDLPGFGASAHTVPDYSLRAHARYVLQLMDRLGIGRAHVLGYSMGGGVALNLIDLAPDRIVSLTMVSSIGVQEMELLGDYHINHLLHGAQLAAFWLLREGTPHMGWLDDPMLGLPYARNFFDSDQRPLREILCRVAVPTLVVHGRTDVLVPIEAAYEDYRLVPQSELRIFDGGHFMVYTNGAMLGTVASRFILESDQGREPTRRDADPARLRASLQSFDQEHIPVARGVAVLVLGGSLAAVAAVAEGVACILAGVLLALGRIGATLALASCSVGTLVADVLLFFVGRRLAASTEPSVVDLEAARESWCRPDSDSRFFKLLQRFLPDPKRPSRIGAGLVEKGAWDYLLGAVLATAIGVVLTVGASAAVASAGFRMLQVQARGLLGAVVATAIIVCAARLVGSLVSFRRRRQLVSSWCRVTRWEFWPRWVFYPPVIAYLMYLMVRYRSATIFTASNPSILAGGFVGESKFEILQGLSASRERVARAELISATLSPLEKLAVAKAFMADNELALPVVLKPDQGQRGSGVAIVRSEEDLRALIGQSSVNTIIQEHVPGAEFGVFYVRRPSDAHGRIFSVTEKRFPTVVGDGRATLEELILGDARAVCMAELYCRRHRASLTRVPAAGEEVPLVELGTHCRGAMFLDGRWVLTPAIEAVFDDIGRAFEGFYFGRFDVRTPAVEDFRRGQNFKIIELNGVTSEATHIYDPDNGLLSAYRVLFEQWRLAFEIGEENRQHGVRPTSVGTLITLMRDYRRTARLHLDGGPHQLPEASPSIPGRSILPID